MDESRIVADDILSRARSEAAVLVEQARQQARAAGDSQLKVWQEAFEAREAELTSALGAAVTTVIESVLRSLLGSDAGLPVRMSIEVAMKALNSELRSALLVHPLDVSVAQEHQTRLGASTIQEDPRMPRGQALFTSSEGEVRVDGERVVDRLVADLRQLFATRLTRAEA